MKIPGQILNFGVITIDPRATNPLRHSPFETQPAGDFAPDEDATLRSESGPILRGQGSSLEIARLLQVHDFARFIGPNAASYLTETPAARRKTACTHVMQPLDRLIHWHWPAFLATVPWLFYRKMYAGGLILVAVPVVLNLVIPGGLFLGWTLLIALVSGLFARRWYLEHAKRQILQARRNFSEERSRVAFLRHAGGVSVPGAILGSAIETATVAATLSGLLDGNGG